MKFRLLNVVSTQYIIRLLSVISTREIQKMHFDLDYKRKPFALHCLSFEEDEKKQGNNTKKRSKEFSMEILMTIFESSITMSG